MHTKTTIVLLTAALLAANVAQAKDKFSCPVPDGVKCMSTIDVYRATNNADRVTPVHDEYAPEPQLHEEHNSAPSRPTTPVPAGRIAYRPAEHAQLGIRGDTLVVTNVQPGAQFVPAANVQPQQRVPSLAPVQVAGEPYREPARIMKVFVSAWQDEQGDLHLPENVITEIEPRRWTVGAPAPQINDSFRLLELPGQEAAKDSRATTAATVASSQSGN